MLALKPIGDGRRGLGAGRQPAATPRAGVEYPSPPAQGYRPRAAEQLGFRRVILLVMRDPFGRFFR